MGAQWYCITSISGSILADKGCSFTLAPCAALEKFKIMQGYHKLLFIRVCQVTAVDIYVVHHRKLNNRSNPGSGANGLTNPPFGNEL